MGAALFSWDQNGWPTSGSEKWQTSIEDLASITLMSREAVHHRYLIEVDCSSGQFKSTKLKDKEYTLKAPILLTTSKQKKEMDASSF